MEGIGDAGGQKRESWLNLAEALFFLYLLN